MPVSDKFTCGIHDHVSLDGLHLLLKPPPVHFHIIPNKITTRFTPSHLTNQHHLAKRTMMVPHHLVKGHAVTAKTPVFEWRPKRLHLRRRTVPIHIAMRQPWKGSTSSLLAHARRRTRNYPPTWLLRKLRSDATDSQDNDDQRSHHKVSWRTAR
jgi:hypothetical protein